MTNKGVLATLLGILSGAILAYTSVVLLAPVKWNLRYLGGAKALLFSLALSVLLSVVAAKRTARRRWYLLIAWAAAIVVYLAWFYHPPMWS
jgi:CBS domain containing-hemolysin-like protein